MGAGLLGLVLIENSKGKNLLKKVVLTNVYTTSTNVSTVFDVKSLGTSAADEKKIKKNM